jgi:hypothetical protein
MFLTFLHQIVICRVAIWALVELGLKELMRIQILKLLPTTTTTTNPSTLGFTSTILSFIWKIVMLEKIACLLAMAATRNQPSFAMECLQYDVKPKWKLSTWEGGKGRPNGRPNNMMTLRITLLYVGVLCIIMVYMTLRINSLECQELESVKVCVSKWYPILTLDSQYLNHMQQPH